MALRFSLVKCGLRPRLPHPAQDEGATFNDCHDFHFSIMADLAQDAGLQRDDAALSGASKLFVHLWGAAWSHAPGTLAGDADALHDMRVAIRRLRSALQNFEGSRDAPLLGARLRGELAAQRKKLSKLGDALGAVRDYDVLDKYLRDYATTQLGSTVAESPGLARFERYLQDERAVTFAPMTKRIHRAREEGALRERFARFALGLPAASLGADDSADAPLPLTPLPLHEAARRVLPQRVDEVLRHAPALEDDEDAIGHHELRKSLKRLRYSLEFFAPCFDQPTKRHLKNLTRLQDLLGEMNDRHVLQETARRAFIASRAGSDGTRRGAKRNSKPIALPDDAEAFLDYGEERARQLLEQVRKRWSELQERDWPGALRDL